MSRFRIIKHSNDQRKRSCHSGKKREFHTKQDEVLRNIEDSEAQGITE